ncbi:MAG: sigma factor-like helix-turn-helix DNA-binding protein [Minisyncoccota bacterium]
MRKFHEGIPKVKSLGEQAPKEFKEEKSKEYLFSPKYGPADGAVTQSLINYINAHEIHESELMSKDPAKEVEDRMIAEETIKKGLASLPEREARIITLRFGLGGEDPKTLEEVGKVIGLTRDRIRQLEERALLRLRRIAVRKLGFDEFTPRKEVLNPDIPLGLEIPKYKTDILGDIIPTKPHSPKSKTE